MHEHGGCAVRIAYSRMIPIQALGLGGDKRLGKLTFEAAIKQFPQSTAL